MQDTQPQSISHEAAGNVTAAAAAASMVPAPFKHYHFMKSKRYNNDQSNQTHLKKITNLLENDQQSNERDGWNKIVKTTKLEKLLQFAERQVITWQLSESEHQQLVAVLNDALNRGKLQRIHKDVQYNRATSEIIGIPGLLFDDSTRLFCVDNSGGGGGGGGGGGAGGRAATFASPASRVKKEHHSVRSLKAICCTLNKRAARPQPIQQEHLPPAGASSPAALPALASTSASVLNNVSPAAAAAVAAAAAAAAAAGTE